MGGLEVINEYVPYVPIDLDMVNDVSFEEHLETLHKLDLEVHIWLHTLIMV